MTDKRSPENRGDTDDRELSRAPAAAAEGAERDNGAAEENTPEFLLKTIENIRKERDEYYDLLLRKQAEFENYRKRVIKDREEARSGALADISKQLLLVIDAAEKGLENLRREEDPRLVAYREGYQLLVKNLRDVLEKFGVRQMATVGAQFDPNFHEAVMTESTDEHEEGKILEEYRKGYVMSDRLLRAAQVKVAIPGPDSSD